MTIILASASPRRAELLQQIGLQHEVAPSDVDETVLPGETGAHYVERLAATKARVARQNTRPDNIIIAADTAVCIDDTILGKPLDQSHCLKMLSDLSGRVHTVHTAVVVSQNDYFGQALSSSEVTFRDIEPEEARQYWHTGEPRDKAGGYAIQGLGSVFVAGLSGSYSGVVGLPVFELTQLLRQINVSVF